MNCLFLDSPENLYRKEERPPVVWMVLDTQEMGEWESWGLDEMGFRRIF